MPSGAPDADDIIRGKLEALRKKILDPGAGNPLVSVDLEPDAPLAAVRIVGEPIDVLAFNLGDGKAMTVAGLPPMSADLARSKANAPVPDGLTPAFKRWALQNGVTPEFGLPPSSDGDIAAALDDSVTDRESKIQTLLPAAELEGQLGRMLATGRAYSEETGLNVFHAAFGLLDWSTPKNGQIRSPILMLPLKLGRRPGPARPEFTVAGLGEGLYLNHVLAALMRGELALEPPPFEPGASPEDYLGDLARSLAKLRWGGTPPKVERQALLGLFPHGGPAIHRDLDPERRWYRDNPSIRELIAGGEGPRPNGGLRPGGPGAASPPGPEEPELVLPADPCQIRAAMEVLDQRNLAVEGPPGTGKSQTIANVIALALSRGQKVLFVADKPAALEVVNSRLEAAGLGEFVLALQAGRSSRPAVIGSVRRRLALTKAPDPDPLASEHARIRAKADKSLDDYAQAMARKFDDTNLTVREILGRHLLTRGALDSPATTSIQIARNHKWDLNNFADFEKLVELGDRYWSALETATGRPRGGWRKSLERLGGSSAARAAEAAKALAEALEKEAGARTVVLGAAPELSGELAVHFPQSCLSRESSVPPPPPRSPDRSAEPWTGLLTGLAAAASKAGRLEVLGIHLAGLEGELRRLLEEASRYQSEIAALSASRFGPRLDPAVPATLARLARIDELARRYALKSVEPASLSNLLGLVTVEKSRLAQLYSQLTPLVDAHPELGGVAIEDLGLLGDLAREAGRQVLELMASIADEPGVWEKLGRLPELLSARAKERATLADELPLVNLDTDPGPDEDDKLESMADILNWTGFRSKTSPTACDAKWAWVDPDGEKTPNPEAKRTLRSLISWRRAGRALVADPVLRRLGVAWPGIRAGNSLLTPLLYYRKQVLAAFPESTKSGARNLALKGDPAILLALPRWRGDPEIPDAGGWENSGPLTAHSLPAQIAAIGKAAAAMNDDLAEFRFLFWLPERPVGARELSDWLDRAKAASALKKSLLLPHPAAKALGPKWRGPDTRASNLAPELEALAVLDRAGDRAKVLVRLWESGRLDEVARAWSKLPGLTADSAAKLSDLEAIAGINIRSSLRPLPPMDQADFVRSMAAGLQGHLSPSDLRSMRARLNELGFKPVIDAAEAAKRRGESTPPLGRILEAVALFDMTWTASSDFKLGAFKGTDLDQSWANRLRLDAWNLQRARLAVIGRLVSQAKPPKGANRGPKAGWTEMALLNRECRKRKGGLPTLQLLDRAPKALMELKPCWMMPPASVSHFLGSEDLGFDLGIVDEASLMPPEHAIPALARCRRLMIVGDAKQLPPSSRSTNQSLNPEVGDDDPIGESILDMALAAFQPPVQLAWHYRSRHPSLINFTNRRSYGNSLMVFPSPFEPRPGLGVELLKVKGLCDGGANRIEAEAMVAEAMRHMRAFPDRSLGLIATGPKQTELVRELLEAAMAKDPAARSFRDSWLVNCDGLEPLFVKNIDCVQGDERDAIIIGTLLGPKEPGKPFSGDFGPLAKEGGVRRLNVLLTRAKTRLVTVTSLSQDDFKAFKGVRGSGPARLKAWLAYAAAASRPAAETDGTGLAVYDDLATHVADELTRIGYQVDMGVGAEGHYFALAVRAPNSRDHLMGLDCDHPRFQGATRQPGRRYRRWREEVLGGLGWNIYKLWSVEWVKHPAAALERLQKALERAKAGWGSKRPAGPTRKSPDAPPAPAARPEDGFWENASAPETAEAGDVVGLSFPKRPGRVERFLIADRPPITDGPEGDGLRRAAPGSPLGRAVLDGEAGDEVVFLAGNAVLRATIVDIFKGTPASGTDRPKRKVSLKKSGPAPNPREPGPPRDPARDLAKEPAKGQAQGPVGDDADMILDGLKAWGGLTLDALGTLVGSREGLYDQDRRTALKAYSAGLVDLIGPIRLDFLAKLVGGAHGLKRPTVKLTTHLSGLLAGFRGSTTEDGETLIWPKGMTPGAIDGYRGPEPGGVPRPWDATPLPERRRLAEEVLRVAGPYNLPEAVDLALERMGQKKGGTLRGEIARLIEEVAAGSGLKKLF